ncbi:MAG TPA: MFS transporter [Rhizomicrobium sp.]|jgi:MFS family permease|nr:MFS transporter [Rhizomicrobium sp.]
MSGAMAPETPIIEAVLPEGLEITPAAQPVEAPQPEVSAAEAAEDAAKGGGGAFVFLRVFRHRNYRLFFTGQLVSLMGTWITNVTQGFLVYSLTHSPLLLGVVSFAGQVPVFFFSAFGGMISDRFDRRRMLLWTQTLACAQSAALAVLTLTHQIQVWMVVCLALFQGFINAFDVPIRQAMTVEMVGRDDLRHAISLNSMMFNLARVIGPPVAGIVIALVGVGICFALDALSYLAVIFCLTLMLFTPRPSAKHATPLRAIAQGFAYAWRVREIRISLFLVAICSAFGASYLTQMPAFARDALRQGSEGLGFLYGAVGAGALTGAYVLARVPDRHLRATPIIASLCFGLALIAFSQSHIYWLSMLLLMPCSFNLMLLGGSTNSIIQLVSRDDMRGRVVALYAIAFMGMMPWGALLLGWAAESFGLGTAVAIGGGICMMAALVALYDRRGQAFGA